jgi:hypothetical protein
MKLKNTNLIALSCFYLFVFIQLSSSSFVSAQTIELQNGQTYDYTSKPGERPKSLTFVLRSKENETSTVNYSITAPTKSIIKGSNAVFSNGSASITSIVSGYQFPQKLADQDSRFKKQIVLSKQKTGNGSDITYCNGHLLDADLPDWLFRYRDAFGRNPSPFNVLCDYINPEWETIPGDGSSGENGPQVRSFTMHIFRDECKKTGKYAAIIQVDLSKVSKASIAAGFKISITATESEFEGRKAASLKPSGDGQFKGQPLLLTSPVGVLNDIHDYGFWSAGRNKRLQRIVNHRIVRRNIIYFGMIFEYSLPQKSLNGRQMTVYTYDASAAYGVCFQAVKRRQYYNGYPN